MSHGQHWYKTVRQRFHCECGELLQTNRCVVSGHVCPVTVASLTSKSHDTSILAETGIFCMVVRTAAL